MNKPLISVILPVYNTEQYLFQAIESVRNQTYTNFELIIVDDGSTDSSYAIALVMGRADERIKVYRHSVNAGIASARTTGLSKAKGEYVCWLDSDDYYDSDFLLSLYNLITKHNCDIAVASYEFINAVGGLKCGEVTFENEKVITREEALEKSVVDGGFSNLWNKMFKKKCCSDIIFPEGELFEDFATAHQFFLRAENGAVFTSAPLYTQRVNRKGSICNTTPAHEFIASYHICKSHCRKIKDFEKFGNEKLTQLQKEFGNNCLNRFISIDWGEKEQQKYKQELEEWRKNNL